MIPPSQLLQHQAMDEASSFRSQKAISKASVKILNGAARRYCILGLDTARLCLLF